MKANPGFKELNSSQLYEDLTGRMLTAVRGKDVGATTADCVIEAEITALRTEFSPMRTIFSVKLTVSKRPYTRSPNISARSAGRSPALNAKERA